MQDSQQSGQAGGVALTIYNQNFALVRDRRVLTLAQGRSEVVIEDVAARIEPTSVHFKSLTAPDAVAVREQNYQYDLLSPATLLAKSAGRRITIRQKLGDGQTRDVEGVLLTASDAAIAPTGTREYWQGEKTPAGMVIQTDAGGLLLDPEGEVLLHEMPVGLIPRPRLTWLVDSDQAGQHEVEISYLTQGVTWEADYVMVLSGDDKTVDLTGWVTLDNQSGATYENAHLQLIAGDVRRVVEERGEVMAMMGYAGAPVPAAAAPQFEEQSFFEYHLYTLDGTTTARQNEQKQMTLLNANNVPAEKRFMYDGRSGFWGLVNPNYQPNESLDTSANTKVNLYVTLENRLPRLGIPLPKGKMKFYKADAQERLQFIGEDKIEHTSKDETLRLYLGDAFDLTGEHRRMEFKRLGKRHVEETFEITLRNHRDEPTLIHVTEHVWADWTILRESHPYTKKDARTVEFTILVPLDGETKLTYTVQTHW